MEQKVYDLFDKLDIKYEIIKHPPVFGASDRENIPLKVIGNGTNLLVKDKAGKNFFLISLPIDKKANLKLIQASLGCGRLEFASETELEENLGIKKGNASVLNIIEKEDTKVKFIIDKEILDIDSVCFHPNVNTASIKFSPLDIKKVLDNFNANYVFMEV